MRVTGMGRPYHAGATCFFTREVPRVPVEIVKVHYKATKEQDGTYTIHDVPIFCEVAEGVKNAPADIGRAWMEKAVEAAKALEKENGYLPPLNYGHHKEGASDVRKVGFFRPKRAKVMQFEDKEQCVLTADFVKLSQDEYDRFMRGEYPYRSVEINDWTEPRINHLSLLSHQEPFFKLPMTTGDTIRLDEATTVAQKSELSAERGVRILFCEDTEALTMPKLKISPEDAGRKFIALFEAGKVDAEGNILQAAEEPEGDEPTDAEFADFARKAIKLSGEEVDADATDEDLAAFGRELLEEVEAEESDDDPTPAELDGKHAAKLALVADKADEALERVGQFEADQKAEKDTAKRIEKAKADLAGYNLGKKTLAGLEEAAKTGGAQFDAYVAMVKENAPREPVTLAAETVTADPILKDLNVRPEDAEDAVRFAQEFEVLEKRGLVPGISKKDHILSQFQSRSARAGFVAMAAGN
jgi:hypothetical protein